MLRILIITFIIYWLYDNSAFSHMSQTPNSDADYYNLLPTSYNYNSAAYSKTTNQISITIGEDYRYIKANGIPNHETGQFPNRGNPNYISSQNYNFKVPLNPKYSGKSTELGMQPFGIALNGVLFDPKAAEFWNNDWDSGWNYNALSENVNLGFDQNNAHVQPNGTYHYHGLPYGALRLEKNKHSEIIGWAADGFPIYAVFGYAKANNSDSGITNLKPSYRLKSGTRPSGPGQTYDGTFVEDYEYVAGIGDLDECNGRLGITPEYPDGTYYYVITAEFPYVPRCYNGNADNSFKIHGQGKPPRGRHHPDGRRPPPRHHRF